MFIITNNCAGKKQKPLLGKVVKKILRPVTGTAYSYTAPERLPCSLTTSTRTIVSYIINMKQTNYNSHH